MDAMPVQLDGQPFGHDSHDVHSVRLGVGCNLVNGPGDEIVNVGEFFCGGSALIEELFK